MIATSASRARASSEKNDHSAMSNHVPMFSCSPKSHPRIRGKPRLMSALVPPLDRLGGLLSLGGPQPAPRPSDTCPHLGVAECLALSALQRGTGPLHVDLLGQLGDLRENRDPVAQRHRHEAAVNRGTYFTALEIGRAHV